MLLDVTGGGGLLAGDFYFWLLRMWGGGEGYEFAAFAYEKMHVKNVCLF